MTATPLTLGCDLDFPLPPSCKKTRGKFPPLGERAKKRVTEEGELTLTFTDSS